VKVEAIAPRDAVQGVLRPHDIDISFAAISLADPRIRARSQQQAT
jgi:hypothetical protein